MTVTLYIGLALVVYLVMLNGFLRGAKKGQIDAGLSVAWITLLGLGFYLQDWGTALLNIIGCFVFGWLVRPLARVTATWIFAHPPK